MSIDIRNINRQLSHLITKPPVGSKRRPSVALQLLNQLRNIPMNLERLFDTKVGKTVNRVRAQKWSEEVTKLAHQIIIEWKQLLPRNAKNVKKAKKSSEKKGIKSEKTKTNKENAKQDIKNPKKTAKNSKDKPKAKPKGDDKTVNSTDKLKAQVKSDVNKEGTKKALHKKLDNECNKENIGQRPLKPISKTKNQFMNSLSLGPRAKKFTKLPPIGQLPEFSEERLRQKRIDDEIDGTILSQPSTSKSIAISKGPQTRSPTNGVGGHQLYEKIVRKRKLERTSQMDSPRKRAMTFATVSVERYRNNYDRPRVQNLPVPHSVPILTPADRLKIIQTRNLEKPSEKTESPKQKVVAYKDEHEIELDSWRVRSVKSMNRIIPRKEHRPKWIAKK